MWEQKSTPWQVRHVLLSDPGMVRYKDDNTTSGGRSEKHIWTCWRRQYGTFPNQTTMATTMGTIEDRANNENLN